MAVTKARKEAQLTELKKLMKEAKSVIFADSQGTNVKDLRALRGQLRDGGSKYKVAKKTLIRLAAKEIGYGEIPEGILNGQVGMAFSIEDEISAAKTIYNFSKKNKTIKLIGALFEGKVLSIEEAKQLATIPSKEELIAKFIFVIKSPITGFHGVLQNTISGFVRALNAIKDQKTA